MTPQIEAAVNWWADKLNACKQSGLSEEERRDPANRSYELAEMLMTLCRPEVSAEQVEKFKQSLATQIEGKKPYCLSVDYGPDMTLGQALRDAAIPITHGTLPIKTNMWLQDGKVEVSYGYGAPIETIFSA